MTSPLDSPSLCVVQAWVSRTISSSVASKKAAFQLPCQQGTPLAMPAIGVLIDAATVMKEDKQLDHMSVGACGLSQHQAIDTHPRPVGYAVVAMQVDFEIATKMGDQSPALNMAHRQFDERMQRA